MAAVAVVVGIVLLLIDVNVTGAVAGYEPLIGPLGKVGAALVAAGVAIAVVDHGF